MRIRSSMWRNVILCVFLSARVLLNHASPTAGNDRFCRVWNDVLYIPITSLLVNDSDPSSAISFVSVSAQSTNGVSISVDYADIAPRVVYGHAANVPDAFDYVIKNAEGLTATGRVDVIPGGVIIMGNRNIAKADDAGIYNVPIYVDANFNGLADAGEGIGTFATNVLGADARMGLFLPGNPEPLATAKFRKDTYGEFVGNPSAQVVILPGQPAGERARLQVRIWVGADFESSPIKGTWEFESLPLGGWIPPGAPIVWPTMTGWGSEDGRGYLLQPRSRPTAINDRVIRAEGATINISIAQLLANDWDPEGRPVKFVQFDATSANGAVLTNTPDGASLIYRPKDYAADFFNYWIANPDGGESSARVDVIVSGATISFSNHNIARSVGASTYDVPIYIDKNLNGVFDIGEDIGGYASELPQTISTNGRKAFLGLFLKGATTPLATLQFTNGSWLSPVNVAVPGFTPGQTAPLTIKAWIGSSYGAGAVKGSWDFTSLPLGGISGSGDIAQTIPGVTGWGAEDGSGFYVASGSQSFFTTKQFNRVIDDPLTIPATNLVSNSSFALLGVENQSAGGGTISLDENAIVHYFSPSNISDSFRYTYRNLGGYFGTGVVQIVTGAATRLTIQDAIQNPRAVSFRGLASGSFTVQYRPRFANGVAWADVGTAVEDSAGDYHFDMSATNSTGFYRVVNTP